MTPDRDIERVLEAWLTPGPTEMPDRVYVGVLDRIERVPQRRLARTKLRFQTMNPLFKLAAAAVLALVVGVSVGPLVLPPRDQMLGQPSPEPSASPTPALSVVAAELQRTWVSDYRVIDGLDNADAFAVGMALTSGSLQMALGSDTKLGSLAQLDQDGLLRLETRFEGRQCAVGDVGTYAWSVSDLGPKELTLEPVEDACALRAAVLAGTWVPEGCDNPNGGTCQGLLAAGVHESIEFEPRSSRDRPRQVAVRRAQLYGARGLGELE